MSKSWKVLQIRCGPLYIGGLPKMKYEKAKIYFCVPRGVATGGVGIGSVVVEREAPSFASSQWWLIWVAGRLTSDWPLISGTIFMKFGFFCFFIFSGGANRSHPPPFERFFWRPLCKNIHRQSPPHPFSLFPFFSPGQRRTSAIHTRPSSLANRFIVGGDSTLQLSSAHFALL